MKIRKAKKEDLNKFVDAFGKEYFDSKKEAKEHFKDKLKSKVLFLFFIDSELAGFFDYIYQYSHNANYLYNLCVSKKFRRKGYSKILLSKYIEISKEQKTRNVVTLSSTHRKNVASQKMHLSFGFKEMGILKKLHYGDDEIFYSYNLR